MRTYRARGVQRLLTVVVRRGLNYRVKVRYDGGAVELLLPIRGFDDFVASVREANPGLELHGV
jgi:hypothetical protein